MIDEFGPFSVDPAQLTGLGGALFQELVNRLLAAEVAAAALSSVNLRTSYQSNVKDQGVDARLEAARATAWVPTGDSAWQFKAGTLGPEGCADELAEATFAHEIIRNGGTYRLVLGKGLEAKPIEDREAKLREKAAELGFIDEVIYPRTLRARLHRSLELLKNKRDTNPPKKHTNIPL